MWNPQKEEILVPGCLGQANISLFSFTRRILSLLSKKFEDEHTEYEILGIHWRGGEEDTVEEITKLKDSLKGIYQEIFQGLWQSLGGKPKTVLHKIVLEELAKNDLTGKMQERMEYINQVFASLQEEYENVEIFDARNCPLYNPNVLGSGLFKGDLVHYTRKVNEWVAEQIVDGYKKSIKK